MVAKGLRTPFHLGFSISLLLCSLFHFRSSCAKKKSSYIYIYILRIQTYYFYTFLLCYLKNFFKVFKFPEEHIEVRQFVSSSVVRAMMDTNISHIYLNYLILCSPSRGSIEICLGKAYIKYEKLQIENMCTFYATIC